MSVSIQEVSDIKAYLVHRIMREAFAEYDGILRPPSGALRETVGGIVQLVGCTLFGTPPDRPLNEITVPTTDAKRDLV